MEVYLNTQWKLKQEQEQNGGIFEYLEETITRTRTKWRYI